MLTKLVNFLKEWYQGNLDLDAKLTASEDTFFDSKKTEKKPREKNLRIIRSVEKTELKFTKINYAVFSLLFCVILCGVLIITVNFLPGFADANAPTANEVYEHYVGEGREQTGAVNTVAGMILDYRAFDTLGESFVLFTATCAVLLLLEQKEPDKTKRSEKKERFLYKNDPIACAIVKIIFPITIVFGAYILFNGHLSPGGGFSGGAILGAGFILYAMVFGEDKAAEILTPKAIRIVTISSLSFYCLAKSYSFFTGNEFNGIHSIITPGTPGNFLSGGLILPLNIAVGLVVCCTMYSFYMLFRRGHLD